MEIIQGEFEFDGFNRIALPGAGSVANIQGNGGWAGQKNMRHTVLVFRDFKSFFMGPNIINICCPYRKGNMYQYIDDVRTKQALRSSEQINQLIKRNEMN